MFDYKKFKIFIFLVLIGFLFGVFFSKILSVLTTLEFYLKYKTAILLIFSFVVWIFIILFNKILYNKNIDADVNIGFNVNPVFLGAVLGLIFYF